MTAQSILLVDDDDILVRRLADSFERRGWTAFVAGSHDEAIAVARARKPTHATVDLRMPGPSGLDLLRSLRAEHPNLQIVMVTGYGSIATAVDAINLGAINFVSKPADAEMILAAFARGNNPSDPSEADYEPPSLARAEWEHIQRVLTDCNGNISKAARMLGLHRRTLQRKLSKYPPTG